MGRIDDALAALEGMEDPTERALQAAGLVSTLFKIKGVVLVATSQLAFDAYANTTSPAPEVDLAAFAGELAPRDVLEIMRGQLRASGSLHRWTLAGIPLRFGHGVVIANRHLCRDFTTQLGVLKLAPVEELTADYILAAHHPAADGDAHTRAHLLLVNGLADSFHMDWAVLHALCHRPSHRVGEELASMRLAAKRDVDAMGVARDHVGETTALPKIDAARGAAPVASEPAIPPTPVAEAGDEPVPAGVNS